MRELQGDDADVAVRSPGGVPQVSGAHHPDGRVPAVVAVAVRRVPGPRVAAEEIFGRPRDGVLFGGVTCDGDVLRDGGRRQVAQSADQTAATRDLRRGGRPLAVDGHRRQAGRSPATVGRRRCGRLDRRRVRRPLRRPRRTRDVRQVQVRFIEKKEKNVIKRFGRASCLFEIREQDGRHKMCPTE